MLEETVARETVATSCVSFISEPPCLFPPLCELSYTERAAARPQPQRSSGTGQCLKNHSTPLQTRLKDEGLSSEMATLSPGHGGGGRDSTERPHQEPGSRQQEWDVPRGARNNVIVSLGDKGEQCVHALRHGSQQRGETAFCSGL